MASRGMGMETTGIVRMGLGIAIARSGEADFNEVKEVLSSMEQALGLLDIIANDAGDSQESILAIKNQREELDNKYQLLEEKISSILSSSQSAKDSLRSAHRCLQIIIDKSKKLQEDLNKKQRENDSLRREVDELKTDIQTLNKRIEEMQKQIDQLTTENDANRSMLIRAQIISELNQNLQTNNKTMKFPKYANVMNIKPNTTDPHEQNMLWMIQELFAPLADSDSSYYEFFKSVAAQMKDARNNYAHVNDEKASLSTLDLKKLCEDECERMMLKLLCKLRAKEWDDDDSETNPKNTNVFPLCA